MESCGRSWCHWTGKSLPRYTLPGGNTAFASHLCLITLSVKDVLEVSFLPLKPRLRGDRETLNFEIHFEQKSSEGTE